MNRQEKRIQLYARLLKLYLKSYYRQFGQQIMDMTTDMLSSAVTSRERHRMWLRLGLDLQSNIVREQINYLGDYMKDSNYKLVIIGAYITISTTAIIAFPHVQTIGTTWINTAGGLRVIGLLLYIVALICTPVTMTILALINQPKFLSKRLHS